MAILEPHTSALVKPAEKTVIQGGFPGDTGYHDTLTIGMLAPLFLEWTRYEMRRAPATVQRYGEALQWVIRDIGDQPVTGLHMGHILTLRRQMETRGCREARMAAILHALRAFLKFCREVVRIPTLSSREIRVPRIPRRDVVYLTREEVQRLVEAIIAPDASWEEVPLTRLRFRALVEVLLGTGSTDFGGLVSESQRYPPGAQRSQDRGERQQGTHALFYRPVAPVAGAVSLPAVG